MRDPLRRLAGARPLRLAAGLVLLHLLVAGLAWDPIPHAGGDNTAYLSLARSLLEHGAYVELWEPGRPPHTQYPPGFPVILAVAWTIGLRSWAALKLMMLGFSATAVGVSYLWMRGRTAPAVALALGALLAVAPGLAGESHWVLSDVPFWAATIASLLSFERGRPRWGIGLAFAALAIRTAGLPLVVAIAVWLAMRRRWPPAVGVILAVAAIQILWTLREPGTATPYVSQVWLVNPYMPEAGTVGVVGLVERLLDNGQRYGFTILARIMAGVTGAIGAVVGGSIVAFAGVGFVRRVRGRERTPAGLGLVEIFALLYLAMLLVWPAEWASDRFLIPLLPVLLVYAAEGSGALPSPKSRRLTRALAALVIVGISVPAWITLWHGAAQCRAEYREVGPFACHPGDHRAFLELAAWSRGELRDDAVVLSRKPRQWYWYSGYPGQTYPFSRDRDQLLAAAAEVGARYVVLDRLGGTADAYLLPAIMENRYRFCVIQRVTRYSEPAILLGVLPSPWDPAVLLPDEAEGGDAASSLRLPICPSYYRAPEDG